MIISNDLAMLLESHRFEIQYVDYEDGQYTVPVILTVEKAIQILRDHSIKKVRFTPILGEGSFTFQHKYLTFNEKI